jgi:peroxin-13
MYGGGYNAYGGFGGGMYGGNSLYPGFGNGLYNSPGMGMGYGMNGFDPNNPSFGAALDSATQPTFALLHSLVSTVSSLAQMLESTFMATHSSFFAMVGVVDQLTVLRNALGSVLGLFGLVRWMRDLLLGRRSAGGMRGEFREFINGKPVQGPMPQRPGPPPSKKPVIFFLLAVFGIPYAMHRLMKILAERAAQGDVACTMLISNADTDPHLGQLTLPGQLPPLDPSQLSFARALYPFNPSNSAELGEFPSSLFREPILTTVLLCSS